MESVLLTDRISHYLRIGSKRQGHIATLTTDPLMLHVFVAVGGPLGKLASEEPFWVYAQAEHGGDGRSAARELGKRGYGEQPGERVAREATEKLTPNTNARLVSPETFNLTDAGNAERLVARHGASIRYSPSLGWIIWTGKRWERDESGGIHRMALETIRSIYAEAAAVMGQAAGLPPDDTEFKALDGKAKAIRKHAISSENHARLNAMVDRAHTLPGVYISPDELDRDLWLFNCQNGTIDLRTGELKPHDRSDFITKSSPVTYDPKATAPLWERCLETWQPDISVRQFLARAAGYTLTGDTGEETVFFLFGDGGNGKSKFTSSLEFIMGDYAARIRSDVLMQSKRDATPGTTPDLERLPGTRLLIVSEIEEGARIREGFLKDMTGGESVFVNPKYKPGFQFKPRFKPWLYGNHKPTFRGSDKGIRRRLPLIPFTATIPADERDTALEAKLRAEAPGILAWAVRGCLEWKKGRLQPPSAVTEATESYHDAQDVFGQWIRTSCALVEKAWTPTAELRRSYEAFCEDEGFRATLDGNSFTERLQQAGCQDKRDYRNGKRVRGWSGIALLTDRTNPSGQQDTEDSKNTKSVNIKSLRGDFTVNAVPAVPVSKAEDDDLPDPYADTPGGSRYAPPVTAEDEAEEEVF